MNMRKSLKVLIQGPWLYRCRRSDREMTEPRGIQPPNHQLHSASPLISAAIMGTTSSEGRSGSGCTEGPQPKVTPSVTALSSELTLP